MPNIDRELVTLEEIVFDGAILADIRKTCLATPVTRALIAPDAIACIFLGGALPERWQCQSMSSVPSLQALISQFRGGRGIGGADRSNFGSAFAGFGDGTGGATISPRSGFEANRFGSGNNTDAANAANR